MPEPLNKRRKLMGDINVVPYIDVMLVLLIIFMITAPLLTQGVKVDLPKAAAVPITDQQEAVIVSIDARGRVYLNLGDTPEQPLDIDTLRARVMAALRRDPARNVQVKGDQAVPYGRVIETMTVLQQAGVARIGFLTDPAVQAGGQPATRQGAPPRP
jgi:biopolymer transport protein TolR